MYDTAQMSLERLLEPVHVLYIRVTGATPVTARLMLAWSSQRGITVFHCLSGKYHVKHNLYLHMFWIPCRTLKLPQLFTWTC